MTATCVNCGTGLHFLDRARGRTICPDCRRREDAERAAVEVARRAAESDARALIAHVIEDAYLDEDEEARIERHLAATGLELADLYEADRSLIEQLMIARVNAGRLEDLPETVAVLKRGEVAHLQVPALLMKEVPIREMRGGYRGISVRIAKGVRLSAGSFRGRSVVVGTRTEVADEGSLVVTSRRIVFVGTRRSLEFQFARLLSIDGFEDGVRLHVSNRQNASTFRVPSGEVVVAVMNAAAAAA